MNSHGEAPRVGPAGAGGPSRAAIPAGLRPSLRPTWPARGLGVTPSQAGTASHAAVTVTGVLVLPDSGESVPVPVQVAVPLAVTVVLLVLVLPVLLVVLVVW